MRMWTPRDATNLKAWLHSPAINDMAEGGSLSLWPDFSGNGYDVSQAVTANRPLYRAAQINNKPAVDFVSADYMTGQLPADVLDETVLAVVVMDTAGERNILGSYGGANTGGRSFGANASRQLVWAKTGLALIATDVGRTVPLSTPVIVGGTLKPTTADFNINGVITSFAHAQVFTAGQLTAVGARSATVFPWDGLIADVVIFQPAASVGDRQRTEGFLAHLYGIAANLAADHPYKAGAPQVVENPCETCGAELILRDTDGGQFIYRCENNHWWNLSTTLGWLVIPEPRQPLDPTATGL